MKTKSSLNSSKASRLVFVRVYRNLQRMVKSEPPLIENCLGNTGLKKEPIWSFSLRISLIRGI